MRAAVRDAELTREWLAAWPRALEAWSAMTLLREPQFFESQRSAAREGMAGEIAAIRLQDQIVSVNLATVHSRHLEELALPILAHEVGHHVYVPGNLTDNARMLAAMGRMLTGLPASCAHLAANLYGDLLINDRLQRRAAVDMVSVYRKLKADGPTSAVWKVYARTCEELWRLPAGTLLSERVDEETESDALLLARLIRNFAGDWLRGARRFAAVLYRYFALDQKAKREQTFEELGLHDTRSASAPAEGGRETDAIPDGLTEIDPSELEDDDSFDGDILDPLGERKQEVPQAPNTQPSREAASPSGRQFRQPFEYGQLLKSLGLKLTDHEVTTRYYRERALPYLIPFPVRRAPQATEPLAEGYQSWDASDPLEELDVVGSILRSPVVVPSVTAVGRVYGESPGSDPSPLPVDLDIYVDSSGSMPNPAVDISYLALAAAILTLSALRAGARVQATLWSGAGQFETSGGFVRDESKLLGIITGYLGDGTAFPLHVLRDTFEARKASDRPAHIVVISDNGVDTILAADERGAPGEKICRQALAKAGGGGTLVLNLPERWSWPAQAALEKIGFRIHPVRVWDELIAFARAFVRENYGERP